MKPVAIIANPDSGKDIRRLVAHGSVVHSTEKVNIIRRILLGLDSAGVKQVYVMPENHGLGRRAVDGIDLSLEVTFLDMVLENNQNDSTRAAQMMAQKGVACILVLGGDGTNRVVSKGCGQTPLLPIATGTNNVFSNMVEGTLAGIAAGVLATDELPPESTLSQEPRLEIWKNNQMIDMALIDLVVSSESFVASRAIWEVSSLKEIFLTRAEPENIGFSALGGYLCHLPPKSGQALYMKIGEGNQQVRAPIAPGLVKRVPIESFRTFEAGEDLIINHTPAVLALDGEREFNVAPGEEVFVRLNLTGPRVVNMVETLRLASKECLFLDK